MLVIDREIKVHRPYGSIRHALAVMLLAGLPFGASAAAAGPTQVARCALRDLQLLMLIEFHGEAQDVPSERLAAAYFTMLTARQACAAGRIDEALAIYDSIAITPERSRRD